MKKFVLFSLLTAMLLGAGIAAKAEGSKELVQSSYGAGGTVPQDEDSDGKTYLAGRPFIEWHNSEDPALVNELYSMGLIRQQKINVYVKAGETVYFGDSVDGGIISYTDPDGNETSVTVNENGSGAGYISTLAQETAGPNGVKQSSDSSATSDGYEPLSFTAEKTGVYVFSFKSDYSDHNNAAHTAIDAEFAGQQNGIAVAAWDITVTDSNGEAIKGRAYADYLSMYARRHVYSKVYVLTEDGYTYKTDFNGMAPQGFVFFADKKGLISTNTRDSLYHSIKDREPGFNTPDQDRVSEITNSKGESDGAFLNTPGNTQEDVFYKIFFNKPSEDLSAFGVQTAPETIGDITAQGFDGGVKNFGNVLQNTGVVGQGGSFNFNINGAASSYQVLLDLRNLYYPSEDGADNNGFIDKSRLIYKSGEQYYSFADNREVTVEEINAYKSCGRVILSDSAASGANSIFWDGKDANGNILPAGTYGSSVLGNDAITITPKGGEYHFPLIDAEEIRYGIRIRLESDMTGRSFTEAERSTVYYNNANSNSLRDDSIWNILDRQDYSIDGYDSSQTIGANATAAKTTEGNMTITDMWSYVKGTPVSIDSITLIDPEEAETGQIRGFVFWDENGDGSYRMHHNDYALAGVTVQLLNGTGGVEATATTDASGEYLFNYVPTNATYTVTVISPQDPDYASLGAYTYACTTAVLNREEKRGYQQQSVTAGGKAKDVGFTDGYQPIKITKKWADNETSHAPITVTYTITPNDITFFNGTITGDVVLNEGNGFTAEVKGPWHFYTATQFYTQENIDAMKSLNNGVSISVAEKNTPEGYTTRIYDNKTSAGYTAEIRNTADNYSVTADNYVSFVAADGTAETDNETFKTSHVIYTPAGGEAVRVDYPDNKGDDGEAGVYGSTITTGFTATLDSVFTLDKSNANRITWRIEIPVENTYIKQSGDISGITTTGEPVFSDKGSKKNGGSIFAVNRFVDNDNKESRTKVITLQYDLGTVISGDSSICFGILIDNLYASGATATVRYGNNGKNLDSDSNKGFVVSAGSMEDYKANNSRYKIDEEAESGTENTEETFVVTLD